WRSTRLPADRGTRRASGRRLQRAGELGRDRRRRRACRGASGAAVRLRAGHGDTARTGCGPRPVGPGRRRASGRTAGAGPGCACVHRRRRADPTILVGAAGPGPQPARSSPVSPSTALARVVVDELVRAGVVETVLAPGSRSAPMAMALADADTAGRLRLHVR